MFLILKVKMTFLTRKFLESQKVSDATAVASSVENPSWLKEACTYGRALRCTKCGLRARRSKRTSQRSLEEMPIKVIPTTARAGLRAHPCVCPQVLYSSSS